mmetsp:Transcript_89738/g.231678  ORF Transcript_89738/g.231678 Transcript_89738/m.231678 type:complete len:402 (-) Transcript_89738:116-1321(-)
MLCKMRDQQARPETCTQAFEKVTKKCANGLAKGRGCFERIGNSKFWTFKADSMDVVHAHLLDLGGCCDYCEVDGTVEATQDSTCRDLDENDDLWGLDSIDGVKNDNWYCPAASGSSSQIVVFDTGCNPDHHEFQTSDGVTRVKGGKSFINAGGRRRRKSGFEAEDGNGHGTHCTGTAAGNTYGVASGADIYCVKVLDDTGSGSWSGLIAAIDWVETNLCSDDGKDQMTKKQCIATMSLGGSKSPSVNTAVDDMVFLSGIPTMVAAGNNNADASGYSPASAQRAITVGASNRNIERAWFSNNGGTIDIYAPGDEILSSFPLSGRGRKKKCNTCTARMSGTSMACPHVAGAVALLYDLNRDQLASASDIPGALENLLLNLEEATIEGKPVLKVPAAMAPAPAQ